MEIKNPLFVFNCFGSRSLCSSVSMCYFVFLFVLTLNIGVSAFCSEKDYESRSNDAVVIVSGTVKKLMDDDAHSTNQIHLYKGEVEIKRIFKGDEIVDNLATISPGLLRDHKKVMVEGFGDPAICDNMIRERDTKIFMLNPNGNGELKLNSSVVGLTLYNLDHVDHVVKYDDIPFPTEKPKLFSPCYLYFCPFGAKCHVDEENNAAKCVCEQKCSKLFAPVCGTDRATYSNLCMLERASCLHSKLIKLAYHGECRVRDPCEGHICKYGAECLPSQDGKTARCQCPNDCPSYGDHVGSKPVCGNNGKDYANMCEMRKDACYELKDIRIKYHGKCDPCEDFPCESPKVCQVSLQPERKPECRCSYVCPSEMDVVCGTDGRSYGNKCHLTRQACKSRKQLSVLYRGKCSPENNPCFNHKCGPEADCAVDRNGRASCVCPPECEPVLNRVCGNDSVTYDNECELRRRSCQEKVYVVRTKDGPCGSDSVCPDNFCSYGGICVEVHGKPECQCPQCSEEYDPVCGENGITYENTCKLRQENCERQENVKVVKNGTCDGCGETRCENYALCEHVNGKQRCICPTKCIPVDDPVCGNDGVTYSNECQLRVESCRMKKRLTITSKGTCDKCRGVTCDFHATCENGRCTCPYFCETVHSPVCGTDGRTYVNNCELRKYSCAKSIMIDVAQDGDCEGDDLDLSGSGDGSGDGFDSNIDVTIPTKKVICDYVSCTKYGGKCEGDGAVKKCVCDINCPAVRKPVCGSDGRTYGNLCMMDQQSCIKRTIIKEQDMDNCDEFESEEPCDGAKPIMNPSTGKEYDCSPGQDLCPSHSYCHITMNFSKCCKDDAVIIRDCSETEYGCCPDGETPAKGPRKGGCPDKCECNTIGSYGNTCDPRSKQCTCKPGVGGKRCNRCEVGYWGLHRIGESGNEGCIPCNCNKMGSDRDDCDQMTGRCVCKPSITGMKCNLCQNGKMLAADGCKDSFMPQTCAEVNCLYGATCREERSRPICVCEHVCDAGSEATDIVCGSDGQNYGSECQLELFGCRLQKQITVAHFGACKGAPPTPFTTRPPTRPHKTTNRRHIEDKDDDKPKGDSKTDNDKETCNKIDELCLRDQDCCPSFSRCYNGLCSCFEGYVPSVANDECHEVKINPPVKVDNLTNACSENPCLKGECLLDKNLGYRCACPAAFFGSICDQQNDFTTPSFGGRSWLSVALPKSHYASQDFQIDVVFSTLNLNGIVLFASKNVDGTGDFISITIKDGFVEFRFDLGAGQAVLRSKAPLDLSRTHSVVARRVKEKGTLVVDGAEPVTGSSPSSHSSLDLTPPVLLGYLKTANKEIFERIGVDIGLVGCIRSLKLGADDDFYAYDLAFLPISSDVLDGVDISQCGNNPCKSIPCQNGATCLVLGAEMFECRCKDGYIGVSCETQTKTNPCDSKPCQYGGTCIQTQSLDGFFCQCTHGRTGLKCERESIQRVHVPMFGGDSYMELPLEEKLSISMSITLWLKAFKSDGIILLLTQKPAGEGDFVCLHIERKKLVFTYFLGSEVARIESRKHIRINEWHAVTIKRKGREGSMTIDDHEPVTAEAQFLDPMGTSEQLNIDDRPLVLGGYKDKKDVPAGVIPKDIWKEDTEFRFQGAIQRVIVNGRTIDGLYGTATEMQNVGFYPGPPCDINPCMNGGVCVPHLNLAECRCPSNTMGKRCEKRSEQVDKDQPVMFDGMTYLSYPNEISVKQEGQRSNELSVTFRTKDLDGILLLQAGGDQATADYLSLAVSGGHVELSYNLGKNGPDNLHRIRSSIDVTDGQWHTARAYRNEKEGKLKVDNEDAVEGSSADGSIQLDTDGLLWVGGKRSLPWGLPTMKHFKGCITEVEVKGKQLHLVEDKNGHSTTITFCS